jgi:hypothetical protein
VKETASCADHAWTLVITMADEGGVWTVETVKPVEAPLTRCGFCGKPAVYRIEEVDR